MMKQGSAGRADRMAGLSGNKLWQSQKGTNNMKITAIEQIRIPPSWVWVKVSTDAGITGWGEPYLEGHVETVFAEVERLKPYLLGQDPTETERLWRVMYQSGLGYVGGPVKMSALSGLDMAFWDIKGKACGLPVYRLLGGPVRTRLPVYRALGSDPIHFVEPGDPYRRGLARRTPGSKPHDDVVRGYVETAQEILRWGFKSMKMHVQVSGDFQAQYRIAQIRDSVQAVREAVGNDIELAIDVHNPQPQMALKLAQLLEPFDLLFMEEPVPVEQVGDIAIIASRTTLPIAAGERWCDKWVFHKALDAGARVLQPDLAHAGGFTELKKIAALAECYHAFVAPHCPLSPLSFAACLQLGAALPNYLVQEHNECNDWQENGRTVIGAGYFSRGFRLEDDGCIQLDNAPGLGVDITDDTIREICRKPWSPVRG